MSAAHLLGTALHCALGTSLDASVDALHANAATSQRIHVADFDEPLHVPFHRLADDNELFDPQRLDRLLPAVVTAALDQAGLSTRERRELPVFVGSSCFTITAWEQQYIDALRQNPAQATAMAQISFEGIASRVATLAGSQGPTRSWHTACTSAANALLGAQRTLDAGLARHVLVVGVELANRTSLTGFSAMQLIGDAIRPFDIARTGTVLGEGVGAIVLGQADDAPMRLAGGAANTDTHSVTGANPDGSRLAQVQTRALALAGRQTRDIRAIKAHATGTGQNDLGEARSLHRVFAHLPPVCALKSRLGHTLGACGVIELALFSGALERGFVPATSGFEHTDRELDVTPTQRVLQARSGSYLLNQFGFGGSNTSLVLELA